jgi:hypothetical protein
MRGSDAIAGGWKMQRKSSAGGDSTGYYRAGDYSRRWRFRRRLCVTGDAGSPENCSSDRETAACEGRSEGGLARASKARCCNTEACPVSTCLCTERRLEILQPVTGRCTQERFWIFENPHKQGLSLYYRWELNFSLSAISCGTVSKSPVTPSPWTEYLQFAWTNTRKGVCRLPPFYPIGTYSCWALILTMPSTAGLETMPTSWAHLSRWK